MTNLDINNSETWYRGSIFPNSFADACVSESHIDDLRETEGPEDLIIDAESWGITPAEAFAQLQIAIEHLENEELNNEH